MTTVSTERELFEAWAVTESFNIDRHYDDAGGEYHRVTTRWAWMAWQAARSADTSGARWQPIDSAPQDGYMLVHEDGALRALLRVGGVWHKPGYPALVTTGPWEDVLVGQDAERILKPMGCRLEHRDGCCENPTEWQPMPEPPPAAPGGPAGARRPDENSPSGPSDRALNPQPEAVDRDRGAL